MTYSISVFVQLTWLFLNKDHPCCRLSGQILGSLPEDAIFALRNSDDPAVARFLADMLQCGMCHTHPSIAPAHIHQTLSTSTGMHLTEWIRHLPMQHVSIDQIDAATVEHCTFVQPCIHTRYRVVPLVHRTKAGSAAMTLEKAWSLIAWMHQPGTHWVAQRRGSSRPLSNLPVVDYDTFEYWIYDTAAAIDRTWNPSWELLIELMFLQVFVCVIH